MIGASRTQDRTPRALRSQRPHRPTTPADEPDQTRAGRLTTQDASADARTPAETASKARVQDSLSEHFAPFSHIADRLPDIDPHRVREYLVELERDGRAELAYGRGWRLAALASSARSWQEV